jgi:hypothetical protein
MEFDTAEPPIETVPRQTTVGRSVLNVGVGSATVDEAQPVVFVSYSSIPSALNFKEKSENWHPG